jgi:uncharacterized protein (DUF849 family)
MTSPLILLCAPNGARKTRADHPALPITPGELADCAESILEAGASVMHLHVRDERDRHSLEVERYRAATKAIHKRVGDGLVVQVTTESCGVYRREQQMQVVRELRPEAVSVALREICPAGEAEADAAEFYAWMDDAGIMAQHILYSTEDLARFSELRSRGLIPGDRNFLLFVLGRYTSDLTGDPDELSAFIDGVPADCEWAVCCFGRTESAAVRFAAVNGGHARVGFENNLHLPDGSLAANNAALVVQAAAAARSGGRSLATAAGARRLLAGPGQPK